MKMTSAKGASRWSLSASTAALATSIVAACSSATTPSSPQASVTGVVTDATGTVLAGVAVSGGGATATTGADGAYSLKVNPKSGVVVAFSKSGYLASSKSVTPAAGTDTHANVALKAVASAQPLDATQGGSVTGDKGASLVAAPGVFVDATGKPVGGSVQVALTPLDPSVPGDLAAYPGSFVGTGNGDRALLQTYGVLDVTVTQNGAPLQLAPGQTVTITIPATGTGTLPPTQDLWAFNLGTGTWDHEGTATLSGSVYTAQISHFSYHNIDGAIVTGQATCLTGVVLDATGKPVAGANVRPTEGASIDSWITTGPDGRYCTWVLSGDTETITADSIAPPFGEGTISVTGGASIPFPGSYTCTNLGCQKAPDIVLADHPCSTDADCAGQVCCTANGHMQCLDSFACSEDQRPIDFDAGSLPPVDGSVGNGSCNNTGSVTITVQGQTLSFPCFVGEAIGSEGGEEVIAAATTSAGEFEIIIASTNDFAGIGAGSMLPFLSDSAAPSGAIESVVSLALSANTQLTATVDMGTLTIDAWSPISGGTFGFTIPSGTTFDADIVDTTAGNVTPTTATVSGSVTVKLF
jgi:Carboxypeptidase regulatory-like domain